MLNQKHDIKHKLSWKAKHFVLYLTFFPLCFNYILLSRSDFSVYLSSLKILIYEAKYNKHTKIHTTNSVKINALLKLYYLGRSMVVYVCNPYGRHKQVDLYWVQANQGYIMRPYLKNKRKQNNQPTKPKTYLTRQSGTSL